MTTELSGSGMSAAQAEEIDALFREWNRDDSPGCALGIYQGGEIAYARGYGMSNLEHRVPITPDSIFHVASISKHFATFSIALLEADGELSPDDDVRRYVPEVPDFGQTITLRHLIHHTSGLRDQWSLLRLSGWRQEDLVKEDDVLDLVRRQRELNFAPGERELYSNTGYTLLAVVVKRVTGLSLRQFTQERIFGPLGMSRTHFHDDHTEIVPGRTQAYLPREGGGYQISIPEFALAGATSLFTTVEDLARWEANFTSGQVGGPKVIERMLEPGVLNSGETITYAWALLVGEYRGTRLVEHSGGDHGYRGHFLRLPDLGVGVAVLANLSEISPRVLALQVVDVLVGQRLQAPKAPVGPVEGVELPAVELAAFAGSYREAKSGDLLHFPIVDGELRIEFDKPRRLVPARPGRFEIESWPHLKVDLVPASGQAPRHVLLTMPWNDEPQRFDPIDVANATDSELAELAGTYHSDELDVAYRLGVADGNLVLSQRKFDDVTLHGAGPNTFFHGYDGLGMMLEFSRSGGENATEFRLTDGRTRGLRFVRVASPA